MKSTQWNTVESLMRDLVDRLDQLERRSEKMELILMVREPGSTAAADAYEGLRKQIVAGVTDRLAHLTQLVQFESAVRNDASREVLKSMVGGWIDASGLSIIKDAQHEQWELLFEVVENLEGEPEVLEPAYVDAQSSRVIRRGRIRFGPPGLPAEPLTSGSHSEVPPLSTNEGSADMATEEEGAS